ncbi:uncharacterized protein LOC117913709 isoform X2 [Vitis riparia]|uniref:uncharacterized protein LOC117913709 isoform X2 n=1 Tax=Vitis riparia TaxID=96939 RepID=UPI00155A6C9F|nr:uncharacterized protein LOC117913709 isoform X2 [Vitis riparia]
MDEKEARWGREWKEQGRLYSMSRGKNEAGGFIRLGVSDLEKKWFCVFIPRGKRDKRGWVTMAEKLTQMVGSFGSSSNTQVVKDTGKIVGGSSYASIAKRALLGKTNVITVKAKREESVDLLKKLEYCVVASKIDNSGEDDDLERVGRRWAESWELKGSLGLARLGKGRVLLDFEDLEEARRVVSSGNRRMDGIQLGLDFWSPRSGCWTEEEEPEDIWVRLFGLPVSLWSSEIFKKVGDECGGFITVDDQTRTMGELQWARILVRGRGEAKPNVLEVEVEDEVYAVSLWWECRPVIRRSCRHSDGRHSSEDRGKEISRAEKRVRKGWVSVGLETLQTSEDGTGGQRSGSGRVSQSPTSSSWAPNGASLSPSVNPKQLRGGEGPGLKSGVLGLKLKGVAVSPEAGPSHRRDEVGCSYEGPMSPKAQFPQLVIKQREGPNSSAVQDRNSPQKKDPLQKGTAPGNPHVPEPFVARETEDLRKLYGVAGISETDKALKEEAMRYGMGLCSWGKRDVGTSLLNSSNFDRTPGGEFFDHSGDWNEEDRDDNTMWLTVYEGCNEGRSGGKELGAKISHSDKGKGIAGIGDICDSQTERGEQEDKWEENGLVKFSQFLGFSTEGLEKEILNFLTKIRKRREKIHSKELLDKSKFERELKRLECSINYEGGIKQKGSVQGKGRQIVIAQ